MMRLVCPNCEAKYEVPEDAIPETGRDVQCANCGHAWYQMRPRASGLEGAVVAPPAPAPAPPPVPAPGPVIEAPVVAQTPATVVAAADEVAPAEPVAAAVAEPSPEPAEAIPVEAAVPQVEVEVEPEFADEAVVAAETPVAGDIATDAGPVEASLPAAEATASENAGGMVAADAGPVPAAPVAEAVVPDAVVIAGEGPEVDVTEPVLAADAAPVAAYAVDESVLAILREEADREAQARRAEAARPLETQTELGIDATVAAVKRPVEVISREPEPESEDKLAARRTRLPDVEEINSTLRPSELPQDGSVAADGSAQVAEGRSSFRSGFLLVLTVAILGSALYGSADAIAAAVPSLAGPLKAYVSFVDSLRLQLDGLMQSATVAINGT